MFYWIYTANIFFKNGSFNCVSSEMAWDLRWLEIDWRWNTLIEDYSEMHWNALGRVYNLIEDSFMIWDLNQDWLKIVERLIED